MEKKEQCSYVYYFKCQACYLEFSFFSWKSDWVDKNKPFCPECGKQKATFLVKKISEKPIFSLMYENTGDN